MRGTKRGIKRATKAGIQRGIKRACLPQRVVTESGLQEHFGDFKSKVSSLLFLPALFSISMFQTTGRVIDHEDTDIRRPSTLKPCPPEVAKRIDMNSNHATAAYGSIGVAWQLMQMDDERVATFLESPRSLGLAKTKDLLRKSMTSDQEAVAVLSPDAGAPDYGTLELSHN